MLLAINHHAVSRFLLHILHLNILSCAVAEKIIMSPSTVILRVIALVFIFFARIKFRVKCLIFNILRDRYADNLVKNVRKFEKFDFKYKKAILDLEILLTCKEKKIIAKILRFSIASTQLKSSNAFLRKLLNQEISNKCKVIRTINEDLTSIRSDLHHDMCFIDFIRYYNVFNF